MTDTNTTQDKNYIFRLLLTINAVWIILWNILCLYYIVTNEEVSDFFMNVKESTSLIMIWIEWPALLLVSHNKLKNIPHKLSYILYAMLVYLAIESWILPMLPTVMIPLKIVGIFVSVTSVYIIDKYKDSIEIYYNEKLFLLCFVCVTFSVVNHLFYTGLFQLLETSSVLFGGIIRSLGFIPLFYILCSYKEFLKIKDSVTNTLILVFAAASPVLIVLLGFINKNAMASSGNCIRYLNIFLGIYIAFVQQQDFKQILKSFTDVSSSEKNKEN